MVRGVFLHQFHSKYVPFTGFISFKYTVNAEYFIHLIMTNCKAVPSVAAVIIIAAAFSHSDNSWAMTYKDYMEMKRSGQIFSQSAPSYPEPQYSAPQPPAPKIHYSAPVIPQPPIFEAPQAVYQAPAYQAPQPREYAMQAPVPYFENSAPVAQQKARRPSQQPQNNIYAPPAQPIPPAPPEGFRVEEQAQQPAAEPASEKIMGGKISGTAAVTSDYTFRGITQTRETPAVQTGVEYQHDIGAYIGLWGSNVDFHDGDQAQLETDVYGGYRTAITDKLSTDVGIIYYAYPGADSALHYNYTEFMASGEYSIPVNSAGIENASLGAAFYYSPEYFGKADSSYYLKATGSLPFKNGVTVDGHIGKQWFKDNTLALLPDYYDWSLGVAYALPQNFEAKLEYIDTDIDKAHCADGCDAKVVGTLSKSF